MCHATADPAHCYCCALALAGAADAQSLDAQVPP